MNDLMSQAVDLMIAGMGFVFVFLFILVFATLLMSKLIGRFAPPEPAIKPVRGLLTRSSVKPASFSFWVTYSSLEGGVALYLFNSPGVRST